MNWTRGWSLFRKPILILGLIWGCQSSIPLHSLTRVANPPGTPNLQSPLFWPHNQASRDPGMPPVRFDKASAPDAIRPRSGIWSFAADQSELALSRFELALAFKADGSVDLQATPSAPPLPNEGTLESYLRSSQTANGEEWIAYLQVDRLYRLKVVSPTRMAGDAWYGIRPPQVVPIRAEWLRPPPEGWPPSTPPTTPHGR